MDSSQVPLRLGNIPAGDFTIFIFNSLSVASRVAESRVGVAQLTLSGSVPGLGKQIDPDPLELFVSFTTDQTAAAIVDPEVLNYVQQKNVDRMLQDAVASNESMLARQNTRFRRH